MSNSKYNLVDLRNSLHLFPWDDATANAYVDCVADYEATLGLHVSDLDKVRRDLIVNQRQLKEAIPGTDEWKKCAEIERELLEKHGSALIDADIGTYAARTLAERSFPSRQLPEQPVFYNGVVSLLPAISPARLVNFLMPPAHLGIDANSDPATYRGVLVLKSCVPSERPGFTTALNRVPALEIEPGYGMERILERIQPESEKRSLQVMRFSKPSPGHENFMERVFSAKRLKNVYFSVTTDAGLSSDYMRRIEEHNQAIPMELRKENQRMAEWYDEVLAAAERQNRGRSTPNPFEDWLPSNKEPVMKPTHRVHGASPNAAQQAIAGKPSTLVEAGDGGLSPRKPWHFPAIP